jgi:hypothetical protein
MYNVPLAHDDLSPSKAWRDFEISPLVRREVPPNRGTTMVYNNTMHLKKPPKFDN